MDNNNFVLKLIKADDIFISQQEYDLIIKAIQSEQKYFILRGMFITCSAVAMILPRYGEKNIPPRPLPKYAGSYFTDDYGKAYEFNEKNEKFYLDPINQNEIEEWDNKYKRKELNAG